MAQTQSQTENAWNDLNGFRRDLLQAVHVVEHSQADPSGSNIKAQLENWRGEDDVKHGRLYPALDDLKDVGLVDKGELDRRTNSYETTATGRAELARAASRLQTVTEVA